MSRMSSPRRKKIYDFLVRRDGERCWIGGEQGNRETLVVDHWDNDNSNNDPANLHLLCRRMNGTKNPRGTSSKKQSSVYVYDAADHTMLEPPRTVSAEFLKNQVAEPAFLHWLFAELVRLGRILVDDAVDCGAQIAHVSQVTIHRYLKKATSRVAILQFAEDVDTKQRYVELKPQWCSFRQTDEARKTLDRQCRNWRKELLDGVPGIAKNSRNKKTGGKVDADVETQNSPRAS